MSDLASNEQQPQTTKEPAQVHGRDAIRETIATLAEQAQRELVVFGPRYDRSLFDTSRLSQALMRLVVGHRHSAVRMLIEDAEQLRRENDRLMELARRCSDFIRIHEVAEEHRGSRELFVVIDQSGYLFQDSIDAATAVVNLSGKTEKSSQLMNRFEELWPHSAPLSGRLGLGR